MPIRDVNWMPAGYREMYMKLREQLDALPNEAEMMPEIAQKGVEISKRAFDELRHHVLQHPFKEQAEEIVFFKQIKPRFYSHLLFYLDVHKTEIRRPVGGPQMVEEYLLKRLSELHQFQEEHIDFYMYYRSGSARMDSLYFVRGSWNANPDVYPWLFDIDPAFGTSHDYLVARILADELLSQYLQDCLDQVKQNHRFSLPSKDGEKTLQWTGSLAWLNELIYGLKESAVLNNGNITVGEIARTLQQAFNIAVGNIYRRQQENRLRDKPTPFFDFMKEKYIAYINRVDDNPHSSTK